MIVPGDALYVVACWVLGYLSAVETARMVKWALWFQRRFPKAFSSRLAERTWYHQFIRGLGILLLIFAAIFSLKLAFEVEAYRRTKSAGGATFP